MLQNAAVAERSATCRKHTIAGTTHLQLVPADHALAPAALPNVLLQKC